jgi:sugar phosphate isomerase/epimerase
MQHVLSTHLFVNHRLTTAMLGRVEQAGIPAVEIFCARQHLDYRNKAQVTDLGHWFRDAGLKLHSIHGPMYTDEVWGRSGPHSVINICERDKGRRIAAVDEIKRALDVADHIPFRYMVQHLGVSGEEYSDHKVEAAFSSLDELIVFGRQRGVEILLENIPNALSSAERLMHFLGMTHLNLGFVFDTGHAHLNEGVEQAYGVMKERIRSTHVHDNDGEKDIHLFPMLSEGGTIDWKTAMKLLRSRPDQYPLLLELREVAEYTHPLDKVKEVFDRLEEVRDEDE